MSTSPPNVPAPLSTRHISLTLILDYVFLRDAAGIHIALINWHHEAIKLRACVGDSQERLHVTKVTYDTAINRLAAPATLRMHGGLFVADRPLVLHVPAHARNAVCQVVYTTPLSSATQALFGHVHASDMCDEPLVIDDLGIHELLPMDSLLYTYTHMQHTKHLEAFDQIQHPRHGPCYKVRTKDMNMVRTAFLDTVLLVLAHDRVDDVAWSYVHEPWTFEGLDEALQQRDTASAETGRPIANPDITLVLTVELCIFNSKPL